MALLDPVRVAKHVMADISTNENIRYEPEEKPPIAVALGVGLQAALVILAPIALTVVIVGRIAQQPEEYISWAVFAALLISGLTTVLQAVRFGRLGSGYVLMMGTSGTFIAVCVGALIQGGPETMATLIVVSALFQFLLAARLSWLRRIFTPVVSGTVIMLIAATVMPLTFASLTDIPEGTSTTGALWAAATTLVVVVLLILRAPPQFRLWAPIIAIVVGTAVSVPFGLYETRNVVSDPLIGLPKGSWPGLNFNVDARFWALLPAFVVATIVGAIETIGDGVAIQSLSRRKPRATDYRAVQGALNADGLGNLLSGLAGTLPNTTYSSSISLAEVTGVASRRVGIIIGVAIAAVAFFPKVAALLIAIPAPVAAAYIIALLALLFVQGLRIVVRDGVDHRKAIVVGTAFWLGVGFQNHAIFPGLLGDGVLAILLSNGMTAGAIVAILLMVFMELTRRRRRRMTTNLETESLPELNEFLQGLVSRAGWDADATERLTAAGEETLAVLMQQYGDEIDSVPRLLVTGRVEGHSAEVEFMTALEGENMEDRLAYLGELSPVPDDREVSYRLLQHYASSVSHQKYHGMDIVTVMVRNQGG